MKRHTYLLITRMARMVKGAGQAMEDWARAEWDYKPPPDDDNEPAPEQEKK